jgi:hypothetical protein
MLSSTALLVFIDPRLRLCLLSRAVRRDSMVSDAHDLKSRDSWHRTCSELLNHGAFAPRHSLGDVATDHKILVKVSHECGGHCITHSPQRDNHRLCAGKKNARAMLSTPS